MYGLPRNAAAEQKLAILLRHLGFDADQCPAEMRDRVVESLRIYDLRHTRPGAHLANRSPIEEQDLRDAAFVIGYALSPERMLRFATPETLAAQMASTKPWLQNAMAEFGLEWPEKALSAVA
ncbi:MAG: hypothetical protein ACOVVK_06665 [Elsteraceae bacterium]